MRRTHLAVGIAVLLGTALAVTAPSPPKTGTADPAVTSKGSATPPKRPRTATTLRGEILDMSCYVARGFSGPVHQDCALKCISSGVCMGMMGPDSMVYMLTLDHGRAMAPTTFTTPDPFAQCKRWADRT